MEEKLKAILDQQYASSSLEDYYIKTQKIFTTLGISFDYTQIKKPDAHKLSAFVWVNPDYTGHLLFDLTIFELPSVYIKIINQLVRTNIVGFNQVHSILFDTRKETRDIELKNLLKQHINKTYGILGNPSSKIYAENIEIITYTLRRLFKNLIDSFKGHIVYVDTDMIVLKNFHEIENRFLDYFQQKNKLDLGYEIDQSTHGMFLGQKKYFYETNGTFVTRGLKCS
jgi:DNA polymerase elongation subunit (family B)